MGTKNKNIADTSVAHYAQPLSALTTSGANYFLSSEDLGTARALYIGDAAQNVTVTLLDGTSVVLGSLFGFIPLAHAKITAVSGDNTKVTVFF